MTSGAIVVLIFGFMLIESWPAIHQIGWLRFLSDSAWNPTAQEPGQFNMLPMIVASILVSIGAITLATPLGIGSAIFVQYYSPRLVGGIYRNIIELMAGVPSVVYGLWGLVVLVPIIASWHPPGPSLLAGILILAMMILPTIALMTMAAFQNVPADYIRASAALGLSRTRTILSVVLPAAKSGLFTAVLIAMGRALGETMAVLMVTGNVVQLPSKMFDPVRTLTANMAMEMAYAMDVHRSSLFVSGLLLMGTVVGLVLTAELLSRRSRHAET